MVLPNWSVSESARNTRIERKKEPLWQLELLCWPWEILSSDLFKCIDHQNLLLYDDYNKFPIIRTPAGNSSIAIMNHMESIFPLPAHNRPWATIKLPRVSPLFRSIWYRTNHKRPSVSPVENLQSPWYRPSRIHYDEKGEDPYLGILSCRTTAVDHN